MEHEKTTEIIWKSVRKFSLHLLNSGGAKWCIQLMQIRFRRAMWRMADPLRSIRICLVTETFPSIDQCPDFSVSTSVFFV